MGLWQSYRMRLRRQRLLIRAFRKRRELRPVHLRLGKIGSDDILLFSTLRNEMDRLPHFLRHYRKQGVGHFLIVDNCSGDGSGEYLRAQPDVSLWRAEASYRRARYGMDWLNRLLMVHGHGHWCVTVDPDELLVFPFCDTRPLRALTDWLDSSGLRSFSAMLLDLYPRGDLTAEPESDMTDPLAAACWFDPGNYRMQRNPVYHNLWIQGGPRERAFFAEQPQRAPALNKIPLVRWERGYAYASSTHMLLPRSLNMVYDEAGGEKASGCLLHAKFLSTFVEKSAEELTRRQHYADSHEYKAYHSGLRDGPEFWCEQSCELRDWRQLEELGLISTGNWA